MLWEEEFVIFKTGVDIIEVVRIKENIEKHGQAFLNRVFTDKEIEYCEDRNVQKFQSYAGRFAAKEAVFKAVSGFLDNKFDIEWKDIEVLNDDNGRPFVNFSDELCGKFSEFCNNSLNIGVECESNGELNYNSKGKLNYNIDISISHIKEIAVASVVMQIETN